MSQNDILEDYVTRAEIAKSLNKSERTLERWESRRIGPPVTRIGKTPYYQKESAKKWLRSQEQKQPTRRIR